MKLKQIPNNTVVHTPTEEEAKELLAILHENGYVTTNGKQLTKHIAEIRYFFHDKICFDIDSAKHVCFHKKQFYEELGLNILTLAEFKAKYCEAEKPQPKFNKGDIVRIINDCGCNAYGLVGVVESVGPKSVDVTCDDIKLSCLYEWIEPYTEPETKEKSETPTNLCEQPEEPEAKELNLCEFLRGHEGETFFSLAHGDVILDHVSPTIDSCIAVKMGNGDAVRFYRNGRWLRDGIVTLFPSRTLYEQYPLDPYTAWMRWQEEQQLRILRIILTAPDLERDYIKVDFRIPADRDKCIEEIKAVIGKYRR